MKVPCKNIPVYDLDKKKWSTRSFDSQYDFGNFLLENCYKDPGKYEFGEFVLEWNQLGRKYQEEGRYTDFGEGTPEYIEFWDEEELKSRLGVLWKKGDKWYYTTRCYYFLLNFCPIVNKEQDYQKTFASTRDVQYHLLLYIKLAEIFDLHSCVLKRRQMMYSCCMVAKSINFLWFENMKKIKWVASDDDFLTGIDGSWGILNIYREHLNAATDWSRSFSPDKIGQIKEGYQYKDKNNKWLYEGNESSITCFSIGKDPKAPVGGQSFLIWHEEGGISKNASETLQYMDPALKSGNKRVGSFSIGGSVGDLSECKDLEEFIKNPTNYGFFATSTTLFDESTEEHMCGLFIPAQYGMPEATDEWGNSLVELALHLLDKAENEGFKKGEHGRIQDEEPWKSMPAEKYVLAKSQNPKTIKEAFAWRKVSEFNVQAIERRQEQIKIQEKNGEITKKQGLLYEDKNGEIKLKPLSAFTQFDKPTELGYPIPKKLEDKRGVVTIWEEPLPNTTDVYFAGCDPIDGDDNKNTDSILSLHIYKRGVEEISIDNEGKQKIEYKGSKIVASWRGRFKSSEETNEHGWMLIRYYKALAAIERNKRNFINYGRRKSYNRFIARESDMPLNKDLKFNLSNAEFGFWMDNQGNTKKVFIDTIKEYMEREVSTIHKKNTDGTIGDVVKTIRGIDFIDDYWLLEELKLYNSDRNADSVVSAGAALCIGYIREMDFKKTIFKAQEDEDFKPAPIRQQPTFFQPTRTKARFF